MGKNIIMHNKTNSNINVLKILAIIIIVCYHIYSIFNIKYDNYYLDMFFNYGGMIGVILFFILSGYCIYLYLDSHKNVGYLDFIMSRWKKLSPDYYLSLFVSFFFMESVFYFSYSGLLNLLSHILYIHNLSYNFAGSFNGVCWTLGTIFQFYLVAPLLKRMIDRKPYLTLLTTYFIDFITKYLIFMVLFRYCISGAKLDVFHFVTYGSELYTSVGIFAIGMFLAKKINNVVKSNNVFNYLGFIISIVLLLLYILVLEGIFPILKAPIYSSNFKTVIMLDVLSLILSLIIMFFNTFKINIKIEKITEILIKYEYSIYIWHLLILTNISRSFDFSKRFGINSTLFSIIILLFIVIIVSILISILIKCAINGFKNTIESLNKIYANKIWPIIIGTFIIYIVYKCYLLIPVVKNDIGRYSVNLECNGACKIYESSLKKMDCNNKSCKYLYLDNEETGYLYYYQLRGYFSPYIYDESYVMDSIAKVNAFDEKYLVNYLLDEKPDYVIVRDSRILSENGYELDLEKGKVYRINYDYKDLSNILEEVK